jgi:hypothetical protein
MQTRSEAGTYPNPNLKILTQQSEPQAYRSDTRANCCVGAAIELSLRNVQPSRYNIKIDIALH